MEKISVVMPTYNAEKHLADAIDSVLKQSFDDFEYIIVDDGSTDNTVDIIRSYEDTRIRLIQNKHDFTGSLNTGLKAAKGKYIARMDADDMMHADRLKVQYTVMEEDDDITVCSSWVSPFGENITGGRVLQTIYGIVERPLLYFLNSNLIFHPTVMIRADFLHLHGLEYEDYKHAEDYRLWIEIAKRGGTFYIESQALLYYRVSENQVSRKYEKEQRQTREKLQAELLGELTREASKSYPEFKLLLSSMLSLKRQGVMTWEDVSLFFQKLFIRNKHKYSF